MSLKSIVCKTGEKTCCWCVVAVIVALTLLALTWTVILASNTSVSDMIKIIFPD
jgi:ribosomal protein L30/L7E